jgi:sugar O-acyltransferase (sialic acid O-acetyltransferase NeuD family)
MLLEKIVVIGASGHAGVVIDIIEQENRYQIVGLLDSNTSLGRSAFGYPILGGVSNMAELEIHGIIGGIIAIGDNWSRFQVMSKIVKDVPDFQFVQAIHPSAQIGKGVTVGRGTVIMPNCVMNRDARVGDFCIVNTGATLDHNSKLGNYSSLAPGVRAAGHVSIGNYSAIGIGASIKHGLSIGHHTVIGAGAVVLKDVPDHVVCYGVPASIVRTRTAGDKYL